MTTNTKLRIALVLVLAAGAAMAGLTPETVSLTFNRQQTTVYPSTNTFIAGTSLLVSNIIAQTTAGTVQDLTGLGGYVTFANDAYSSNYTWTATDATNGTAWVLGVIPTNLNKSTVGIWLTLTNATTTYTYPAENRLSVKAGYR